MLTSRIGRDETMNMGLVQAKVGDTVAFEMKDKRGRWRWSLGVVKAKPEPRITEIEVWKKKDKVLSEEEKARSEALRIQIAEQKASINERKQAAEKRIATLEEKRQKVIRTREDIEARLAKVNDDMAKAKAEIKHIDEKDVREMRSYRTPPELIRFILEAVTLILESANGSVPVDGEEVPSKGRARKKAITWDDVLAKIRQSTFIRDVYEFDNSRLLRSTVERIQKDYLSNPRFNVEEAKKASEAVRKLTAWVQAQVAAYDTAANVKRIQEEMTIMDADVAELETQGEDDEEMVRNLEVEIDNLEVQQEDLLEEEDDVDYAAIDEGIPSKAKKGEWIATSVTVTVLTTSILTNLDKTSFEEEFDAMGGRTYRFDPTQVLATARGANAALAQFGSTLPAGFKLSMPGGFAAAAAALSGSDAKSLGFTGSPLSPGADLHKRVKELESKNNELLAERDALQAVINGIEHSSLENSRNEAEADVKNAAATEETAALKKSLEEANAKTLLLEEEKIELADKLLAKGKEHSEASEALHAQLLTAKVKEQELYSSIEAYKERHATFKEDIAKLENRAETLEQERNESRKHNEASLENLSRAMVKLTETVAELEAAKALAAELKQQSEGGTEAQFEADRKIAKANEEVELLNEKINSLEEELDSIQAERDALKKSSEESIHDLQQKLDAATKSAEEVQRALHEKEREAEAAKSSAEEERKKLAEAEDSLKEAKAALAANEGSVDEGIAALARQVEEANKEKRAAEDKATALVDEKCGLEKQLKSKEEACAKSEATNVALVSELASLKDELSVAKKAQEQKVGVVAAAEADRVRKIESEYVLLKEKYTSLESQSEHTKREFIEYKSQMEVAATSSRQQNEVELSVLRNELAALKQSLAEAQEENARVLSQPQRLYDRTPIVAIARETAIDGDAEVSAFVDVSAAEEGAAAPSTPSRNASKKGQAKAKPRPKASSNSPYATTPNMEPLMPYNYQNVSGNGTQPEYLSSNSSNSAICIIETTEEAETNKGNSLSDRLLKDSYSTAAEDASASHSWQTAHLCRRTSFDFGYIVLALSMALAVSISSTVPASMPLSDEGASTTVPFYGSFKMGSGYMTLSLLRGFSALLFFVFVAPSFLKRSNAFTVPSAVGVHQRCAHFYLTFIGLCLSVSAGVVLRYMAPTSWVALLLFGIAEVLVGLGVVAMLRSTGLSLQFSIVALFATVYLVGPCMAFFGVWTVATAFALSYTKTMSLAIWVSLAGAGVWLWLLVTPHVIVDMGSGCNGHLSASTTSAYGLHTLNLNASASGSIDGTSKSKATNALPTAGSTTSNGLADKNGTGHHSSQVVAAHSRDDEDESVDQYPKTAIACVAAGFPEAWTALREVWNTDTQSLVASGVAGSIFAIVNAYTVTMVGFQTRHQYSVDPLIAIKAKLYASAIYLLAIFGIFAVQRGVAHVLFWQGYPQNKSATQLVASPMTLKLCGVAAVAFTIAGSVLSYKEEHIVATTVMYACGLAFAVQELLAELFPSQVYRKGAEHTCKSDGTKGRSNNAPDNEAEHTTRGQLNHLPAVYNKLPPSSLYSLVLLLVAFFVAALTNIIVVAVGAVQQSRKDNAEGTKGNNTAAMIVLASTCTLPALFVLRGLLPCCKRDTSALLHDHNLREHQPLIESTNNANNAPV